MCTSKAVKERLHGMGLIEIVMTVAIISLTLFGTIVAFQFHLRTGLATTDRIKAAFLLEEGIEAVRFLRDTDWSNIGTLTVEAEYHLATTTNGWEATTTPQLIDGTFTRTFVLSDVYRKTVDDDIVPESASDPKALDPGTKRVTARVVWGEPTQELEAITYLTDLFGE